MDLWVLVAAATAGYITKYWQKLSRDRESLTEPSSGTSNFDKPETSNCPFHRFTQRKKKAQDTYITAGDFSEGAFSDMHQLGNASDSEAASSSSCNERLEILGSYNCNVLSILNIPPGFSVNENLKQNDSGSRLNDDMADNTGKRFHITGRKRNSLIAKRPFSDVIKPLSSLESCLMAQLYKEHARMEEYVLGGLPSPSAVTMPLLITDGSQIISRANGDSLSARIGNGDDRWHKEKVVYGVPPLSRIGTLDLPKKINSKTEKGPNERSSSSHKTSNEKHIHSQNGAHDEMVSFCLGVSIGIVSSLVANRREVDKLKEVLKQTENLVRDLQDELEMKDSLTVQELGNENNDSLDTCDNSFHYGTSNPLLLVQNVDNSVNNDGTESYYGNVEESSDSMSKIEAELEAELERLGLNMNSSGPERRLSDPVELESDFVADFAQGELRADVFNGLAAAQSELNRDASSTLSTCSANYAVSPRELSMHLHEVIQSRLEERVKELERALQKSQKTVQHMESEHKNAQRMLPSTELQHCSTDKCPIGEADYDYMPQPLVMNLSGEALAAYDEAYVELNQIKEYEEDDVPSGFYENNNHREGLHVFDHMFWVQNSRANGSSPYVAHHNEKKSKELYISGLQTSAEHGSRIEELFNDGISEDESRDSEDEMEKQLIKQIVEKTKKGSPAVINAREVLFSMDDNEH